MISKKLYKMTNTGKIQEWSIECFHSKGVPCYSVMFGQVGGKMQTTRVEIYEGKNIGRGNETTPNEQCELEAKSLWEKQVNRKGYTEEIPVKKPLRPMLAKNFEDRLSKIEYPVFVQPKLDGCRAITDRGRMISRTGKEFFGLNHITKMLKSIPFVLDGELYSSFISFEEIISRVRKSKTVHKDVEVIKYCVYDIVDEEMTFQERLNALKTLFADYKPDSGVSIEFVETYTADSEEEVYNLHNKFVEEGYEGAIVRTPDGKYKVNGRSNDLLKLKSFDDNEFQVIGFTTGKGKFKNVPVFNLRCCDYNVEFEGVPRGTQEERSTYLLNAESYIGKMVTVRHFGRTSSNEPRFPVITCMSRDYE